jgi:glutamate-ammonia-ligase adenylyltransferase
VAGIQRLLYNGCVVTQKNLQEAIDTVCRDVDPQTRQDFLSRMDRDYFSLFSAEEIGTHLRMSRALNAEQPVRLKVMPRGGGRLDIVIVAYDYFSEFSIVCGLLSSFGLDIRAGHSYTFLPRESDERPPERLNVSRNRVPGRITPAGSSLQKIVDVFNIRLRRGQAFDASRQKDFERELEALVRLLAEDRFHEARERLNRRLIEHLEKMKMPLTGRLQAINVRFDNDASEKWTVMDVRSEDTPAFLYAFSNALSMRGIYVHKVHIRSVGTEARDRFYISDRQGRRIDGKRDQEALKTAVVLIKQFTHFLRSAPDPGRAMRHFDQLLDKILEGREGIRAARSAFSLFRKEESLDLLAQLLGTSDFLWEDFLRMQFESLVPVLGNLKNKKLRTGKNAVRKKLSVILARASGYEEKKKVLNDFKDREMFFIDMKHLVEPKAVFTEFSKALTDLAEIVLEEAGRVCQEHLMERYGQPMLKNGEPCAFSICGQGKFGGREMGYASDVEVLFIYGGPGQTRGPNKIDNSDYFEHLAQEVVGFIEARQEGIFHLDLRLRPYGKKGTLANPIERLKTYYSAQGEAALFERQALIKLRWVAGDGPLGREMETHRDRYVYSGAPWSLEEALHLRDRQMRELVKPGRVNVKYSAGGIIDIEYGVQYQQIKHGKDRPELRVPSTLEALDQLRRLKIISKEEHDGLRNGYVFLRALIDAMRIVRGNARDLVLPDSSSEEFKFLARRMGYYEPDWEKSAEALAADIRHHMKKVHRFFAGRFKPAGERRIKRAGVEE